MDTNQLRQTIALLESKLDMREAELTHVDTMLKRCGFPEGIQTLKETMVELLSESGDALSAQQIHEGRSGTDDI